MIGLIIVGVRRRLKAYEHLEAELDAAVLQGGSEASKSPPSVLNALTSALPTATHRRYSPCLSLSFVRSVSMCVGV